MRWRQQPVECEPSLSAPWLLFLFSYSAIAKRKNIFVRQRILICSQTKMQIESFIANKEIFKAKSGQVQFSLYIKEVSKSPP